jgi:ribosomal protein S18 acetylase RimI-like enzyme
VSGALVDRVLAAAREEGVPRALVYSAAHDARRILDFYERHGFRSWSVQLFQEL